MINIFKKKSLDSVLNNNNSKNGLKKTFTTFDLIFFGIGSVIGSGVFSITGLVASKYAGSAIVISYLIAGVSSIFIGLIYAELASMIPASGSLYSYSYVVLGEIIAFVALAIMFLEIGCAGSFVSSACADYFHKILDQLNINFPVFLKKTPFEGGVVNFIAVLIILFLGFVLYLGNVVSKSLNIILVIIKMSTIFAFILIASKYFNAQILFDNFNPFGFKNVFAGSAVLFFAFNGYANLTSTVEECKNPKKSLTIAIIVAMLTAIVVYSLVSIALTGMIDIKILNSSIGALSLALKYHGNSWGASLIATGAICGMITVTLMNIFSISRIFYVAAQDGMFFNICSRIHPKYKTPSSSIIWLTLILSLMAGFIPPALLAQTSSFAMLFNAIIAILLVVIARFTHKNVRRPFKTPFLYLMSLCSVGLIFYLLIDQIYPKVTFQSLFVGTVACLMVIIYIVLKTVKIMKLSITKKQSKILD
ncbi:MAG: amino acid permease [Rickettsia sp.]|nr:amino acid permease [Rickettsia sp.]